jgi:hypothetical protein
MRCARRWRLSRSRATDLASAGTAPDGDPQTGAGGRAARSRHRRRGARPTAARRPVPFPMARHGDAVRGRLRHPRSGRSRAAEVRHRRGGSPPRPRLRPGGSAIELRAACRAGRSARSRRRGGPDAGGAARWSRRRSRLGSRDRREVRRRSRRRLRAPGVLSEPGGRRPVTRPRRRRACRPRPGTPATSPSCRPRPRPSTSRAPPPRPRRPPPSPRLRRADPG